MIASCVRCQAVIVVTERIADAEMHSIVGHCPPVDELFRLIRVNSGPPLPIKSRRPGGEGWET
jgi:hypothetical protein